MTYECECKKSEKEIIYDIVFTQYDKNKVIKDTKFECKKCGLFGLNKEISKIKEE